MNRSTNMEHVRALYRMANESWRGSPEFAALTAAIVSLSTPKDDLTAEELAEMLGGVIYKNGLGEYCIGIQPDANVTREVESAVAALNARMTSEPESDEAWLLDPRTMEAKAQWDDVARALGADVDDPDAVLAAAKAKPVGAEAGALKQAIEEMEGGDFGGGVSHACLQAMKAALAQQLAYDGGFTAADMMDARQEGRREAQQPTAVDDDTMESLIEESGGHWSEDEFRIEGPDLMRLLRDAALAGQQGGEA